MDDLNVYGFIESRDRLSGDISQELSDRFPHHLDKSQSFGTREYDGELVFSMVSSEYFKYIEPDFGQCDRTNFNSRNKRIQNILNYFGNGQHIYMGHILFDTKTNIGRIFRAGLLPSQWFNIELSTDNGYPFLRTAEGDLQAETVDTLFISTIHPVEDKTRGRLMEIFSLNHIPDLQLFNDEGERVSSPLPSTPPMDPEGKKNNLMHIEEEDEFGELNSKILPLKWNLGSHFKKNRSIDVTQYVITTSKEVIDTTNNNNLLRH